MPAKSFLGSIEAEARQFYATVIRHEIADANVRGYLRAATQIAEIWQQIDAQVAAAIAQGSPPWDAYAQNRYALACIRIARANQVFVEQLLAADAAASPALAGYLPLVTYDQANALCHQIQHPLQEAVAALNDATYVPDMALPATLGPRIEAEDAACPIAHLEGMIAAANEVRDWAAGLLAEYELAVTHAAIPIPAAIQSHLTNLRRQLAEADTQLQFGVDLVGQVTEDAATAELHEEAENNLWAAMETFFLLNQVIAAPEGLECDPIVAPRKKTYRDRRIQPGDLWTVAAPSARSELRNTPFGRSEMREMSTKMGGVVTAGAQQYLAEVHAAVTRGDAVIIAAMANCPFEPLYRAKHALQLAGATIPAGHEFHWDFHRGHLDQHKRFNRVGTWEECEE